MVRRSFPRVADPSDRVFSVLGPSEAQGIFALEPAEQDGVTCGGFFGQPTLSRHTTSGIWAFVNGRFVRDTTVMSAVCKIESRLESEDRELQDCVEAIEQKLARR